MADSMTGYGRGELVCGTCRYVVELKSVNNRYCDVQVRMPRTLLALEGMIRDRVTEVLARGKVDVFITIEEQGTGRVKVQTNLDLAASYSQALFQIAATTGRPDDVGIDVIARLPEVLTMETAEWKPEAVQEDLFRALDQALEDIALMRQREGSELKSDILEKVKELKQLHCQVAQRAPLVVEEYRVRLHQRLQHLLGDKVEQFLEPGRMEAEIIVFADKCAIDEELVRLDSHFSQVEETLAASGLIGKKLDFLLQEMNRETNTIGSKANDREITSIVVEMKTGLEKIREQIQNLA